MSAAVDPADAPSFDEVVADAQHRHPALEVGTMVGRPCLRLAGDFIARVAVDRGLIVRLDKATVSAALASGAGEPFAPTGRVMAAWMLVPEDRWDTWHDLIDEAVRLATS